MKHMRVRIWQLLMCQQDANGAWSMKPFPGTHDNNRPPAPANHRNELLPYCRHRSNSDAFKTALIMRNTDQMSQEQRELGAHLQDEGGEGIP